MRWQGGWVHRARVDVKRVLFTSSVLPGQEWEATGEEHAC